MKIIVTPVKPVVKPANVSEAISNPSSVRHGNKPLTHAEYSAVYGFGW